MHDILSDNRRINYCFLSDDGLPRIVVTIKYKKGNLYFIDINQPWKISYHSPRDGVSQVHLKANLKNREVMACGPDFCCSIEDIRGIKFLGGAGIKLKELQHLPIAKKNSENYILDTRPFYYSELSSIQWQHYIVEPGKEKELYKNLINHEDGLKMTERILIHTIQNFTPLIITEFIRICDKNSLWYKNNPSIVFN